MADKTINAGDFLGSPVMKTSPSNAGSVDSIPGWGAKIPHASWPENQEPTIEVICNKFNKDLKNGSHQENILKKEGR